MTKHAVILGIGSDIGRALDQHLRVDGWVVTNYYHSEPLRPESWDLLVCCYGTLEPIGSFWEQDDEQWERACKINVFLPLRQIRAFYPNRRPGASVCLFSGAGTSGPAPTYSAYAASKVMLIKMVELLDDESPDCKFFILGPGMVRTKIHEQTLLAGSAAANANRVADFVASRDPGTSHDDIYACLMVCCAASKVAVGGRNVYVPLDDWGRLGELAADASVFKLRRYGDDVLRKN